MILSGLVFFIKNVKGDYDEEIIESFSQVRSALENLPTTNGSSFIVRSGVNVRNYSYLNFNHNNSDGVFRLKSLLGYELKMATLRINVFNFDNATCRNIKISTLESKFDTTTTWNNQPTVGQHYYTFEACNLGLIYIDITDMLLENWNNPDFYGFAFLPEDESLTFSKTFSHSGTAENVRPTVYLYFDELDECGGGSGDNSYFSGETAEAISETIKIRWVRELFVIFTIGSVLGYVMFKR
jgi:hypothetical protein